MKIELRFSDGHSEIKEAGTVTVDDGGHVVLAGVRNVYGVVEDDMLGYRLDDLLSVKVTK